MSFNSKLFVTISAGTCISTMFAVFYFQVHNNSFSRDYPPVFIFFGVQNVCTEEVSAKKCLLNLEFNLYLKHIYIIC